MGTFLAKKGADGGVIQKAAGIAPRYSSEFKDCWKVVERMRSLGKSFSLIQEPRSISSWILNGLRILIVDDEQDLREMLKTILEQFGAEIITVPSGRKALDTLPTWKPDLMVCDIGMPEEDGYSVIAQVRKLEPAQGGNTAAIALTGYVGVEERMRALASGYQMFVPKPVEPTELVSIIANLLGRAERNLNAWTLGFAQDEFDHDENTLLADRRRMRTKPVSSGPTYSGTR